MKDVSLTENRTDLKNASLSCDRFTLKQFQDSCSNRSGPRNDPGGTLNKSNESVDIDPSSCGFANEMRFIDSLEN